MKHAFDTKRLRVFEDDVQPTDHNDTKRIYVAFRTDEDRPMVTATMVLWDCPRLGGWVVEWHEVTSEYRRQGFATELREGVERHLGSTLVSDAGSEDGEKFLAAIERL
jgi:hypothetical protein